MNAGLSSSLLALAAFGCSDHAANPGVPARDARPVAPRPDAVAVASLPPAPVRRLALGAGYAVALLADGTVWRWGHTIDAPEQTTARPQRTEFTGITSISVSDDDEYMGLVHGDGTASCLGRQPLLYGTGWGDWWAKQRGVQAGATTLRQVEQLALSNRRACALLDDASLRCWSYQADESAVPSRVVGVNHAVQVIVADSHACALDLDATVWCWGGDEYGQLGDPAYAGPKGRVVTSGNEISVVGLDPDQPPRRVPGLGRVTQLTGAGLHNCALLADATVWCWGGNSSGQLGDGTTTPRSLPLPVPGLTAVVEVASGAMNTCARKGDGTVVCWGHDMFEEWSGLKYARAPAPIAGLDDAVHISVGSYSACALRENGEVTCWGANRYGQLGDGSGASQVLTTVRW